MKLFQDEYDALINNLDCGNPVSAEEVGKLIVKGAHFYGQAISAAVACEFGYNKKIVEFEKQRDENDKLLSSAKAENFAKATDEYLKYMDAKSLVATVEQQINALKSLQKGLSNEFAYNSNS